MKKAGAGMEQGIVIYERSVVLTNASLTKSTLLPSQIIRAFAGNDDVAFGDINLADTPGLRRDYSPGAGGWPTILYFNQETGVKGGVYEKKTSLSMCDELGPKHDYLEAYIEDYGNTSLCSLDGSGCDERSVEFINKMKSKEPAEWEAQINRLEKLEEGNMKDDLKAWVKARRKILGQLVAAGGSSQGDEL